VNSEEGKKLSSKEGRGFETVGDRLPVHGLQNPIRGGGRARGASVGKLRRLLFWRVEGRTFPVGNLGGGGGGSVVRVENFRNHVRKGLLPSAIVHKEKDRGREGELSKPRGRVITAGGEN